MTPLIALLALQGVPPDGAPAVPAYLKDPAYAKPITVEVALQPLNRVVDAMAKASGLPIAASGSVIDLKATVLVKSLPVGRTMEALADTLGLVWRQDGAILRLSRADGASAREAAYLKEEEKTVEDASNGPMLQGGPPGSPIPGQRFVRRRRAPQAEGAKAGPRFDPDLLAVEIPEGTPPSRLDVAGPSGETAFAKAIRTWPSFPADPGEAWSRPVGPPTPASTWNGGKLALSDLLVAWHAASGLPVVADAFRVPLKATGFVPGTALGSLQSLAAGERMSLKLSDGVARLRHPAFWRLRAQETPETAWFVLERSGPNLAPLAAFASGLKPAQAAAFRSQESPLSKVNTTALRESYPALVLWSALPDAARSALLAGRTVGLAQVQGAQDAYVFALNEAPYYGAGDPSAVLTLPAAKAGIFGRSGNNTLTLRLAGAQGEGVGYVLPL